MGAKHNKCCCETPECLLLLDVFDRADSTSLGSDWTEKAGDAEIVSNQLILTAGDKVATTVSNASHRGVAVIYFEAQSGPFEINVILNYGTTEEVVTTIEWDASSATLTTSGQNRTITTTDIGQRSQLLWREADADYYIIEVSVTGHHHYCHFYAYEPSTDGANFSVWDHEFVLPTTGAGKLAIESVAGTIGIETVEYYRHYDDDNTCPDYGCVCTDNSVVAPSRRWVPWKTRVDFFSNDSVGTGCYDFNLGWHLDFEIALDGGQDAGASIWDCVSGLIFSDAYGPGESTTLPFFNCTPTSGSAYGFSLSVSTCATIDTVAGGDEVCDPFEVTYDEVTYSDIPTQCDACTGTTGSWYAVMTDDTP